MASTYRSYPVREIAIALFSGAPLASGHERVLEGDIVAVRQVGAAIGTKERARFLWLLVEGLSDDGFGLLTDAIVEQGERFEKRRYCVPLVRLTALFPALALNRMWDSEDEYQPFRTFDEDDGVFLASASPVQVQGLIFDRAAGRYL